jgi:NAD(P)-dependent dehydrogenase (short-subunit alcohol dehydrogenase family)
VNLKNASVVITGGAQGLGAALLRELKEKGARVLVADIDQNHLEKLTQELGVTTTACNVTDRSEVTKLAEKAIALHGQIDIWINNAGLWMPYASAQKINFARAHDLMEVNYFGLAYGTLAALGHMRPAQKGIVCNIISVRALKGKAMGAAYSASKFAAEGFTQAVRDEVRGDGISVVAIYPYRIKTNLFGENKHADYNESMDPKEVAKIIVNNLTLAKPAEHVEIWQPDDIRKKDIVE